MWYNTSRDLYIQTDQFMPVKIRSMRRPLAWNTCIFFQVLMAHHTLWASASSDCFVQFLCYNSFNVIHVCRLAHAVQNASNYILGNCCTCSTLTWHACSVWACVCSLELWLFVVLNTGYREMWSVCVFIEMVIGYNWIHWMRDMTPSTH